jgi:peptidoglycan/xylan/chitin deacetylase (PgdA/CDA1 family)
MPVLAVNFHYVGMPDYPHPGVNSLDPERFRALLEGLSRDFECLGLPDLRRHLRDGSFDRGAYCLVTFDDGLRCQVEQALPVLDRVGVPAAFFVQSGPRAHGRAAETHKLHYLRATRGDAALFAALVGARRDGVLAESPADLDAGTIARHYRYDAPEAAALKFFFNYHLDAATAGQVLDVLFARCDIAEAAFVEEFYLTRDQIRALGDRGAVGSHGVSHRPLARLAEETAAAELAESRRDLSAWSGMEVEFVSYPFGNEKAVNPGVGRLAAAAGYCAGFTMERAKNHTAADPLLLARIDVLDLDGHRELPARSRYFLEGGPPCPPRPDQPLRASVE